MGTYWKPARSSLILSTYLHIYLIFHLTINILEKKIYRFVVSFRGFECNIEITYRTSRFIVVQVHFLAQTSTSLSGVDEFARKFESEADVVRAAAPFPISDAGHIVQRGFRRPLAFGLMTIIARTWLDAAFGTRSGNGVSDSCTRYCVNESCFPTSWNR